MLKSLGAMDAETRAAEGPKIHALREAVSDAIAGRKAALEARRARAAAGDREGSICRCPAPETPQGTVHPVSQVMDELAEIFADLGFAVAEGPEIEDQWYNFTALNMPENHPARAMQDTFYLEPREARMSRACCAPTPRRSRSATMMTQARRSGSSRPGRVYRSDSDATHTPMFHQVEGLVIDKAHHAWATSSGRSRLSSRPSSSATTSCCACARAISRSPSLRPRSMSAGRWKRAAAWSAGRKGGWKCWAAAWSTRAVIANCGLDPDEWQGFAFGSGVDRLAMLKYGMDDLRAFFDGDIRWLKHYGFRALDVPTLVGRGRRMKFSLSLAEGRISTPTRRPRRSPTS